MTTAPSLHVSSRLRRGMNGVFEGDDALSCDPAQPHPGTFAKTIRLCRCTSINAGASTPEPQNSSLPANATHSAPFKPNMRATTRWAALAAALLFGTAVTAHEHHVNKIAEGEVISQDPIDSILWTHILVQGFAWGIIFPTGMVLGVSPPER
jgi:hypothetical protein